MLEGEGRIKQVAWVDDTVTEIMQAAKEEAAAAAAELSEAPDSKMEEEAEVPSEADETEAEEDDGIHTVFL